MDPFLLVVTIQPKTDDLNCVVYLGGVPEVSGHVDSGHDSGEGGEEDAEDAEPVVVLRVVGPAVGHPHRRVPTHETALWEVVRSNIIFGTM